ncbi:MAG TPA: type II and III secretion system protein family protein [Allosphingosinicella sp.]|nr:type II and III secretion system protein family protein [Allosphingosinicella sp.]
MTSKSKIRRAGLRTAIAAALTAGLMAATSGAPAMAQGTLAPANDVTLSVGTGRMVRPTGQVAEVFVADENIADVHASTPSQIYIFGKTAGNTTVYATDRSGRVVYSANVRVGQNLGSVAQMLEVAMPEADITATPMNGMVLLTGTVAQPSDAAEAERLVKAFVGANVEVVSRLRTATPQQVYLQVRIAEVSRSLARDIGVNVTSADQTGGFQFGIGQGRGAAVQFNPGGPMGVNVTSGGSGTSVVTSVSPGGTLAAAGRLLGVDLLGSLDLGETTGQVVTLAEPTLVALSGETATFLAGGEFPIPIPQSLGTVTIEYKQYGVGLAFSPTVLENGRISIRVRPEVSELSATGSVRFNGFEIPSLTTRRAETTVELGSGQSFVIGGLLRNSNSNSIARQPGLGNIPIIGALFRSTRYRREETELMIVVTPYLVRPVSANQVVLPTDGYRNPDEASRLLLGTTNASRNEPRPMPTAAEPRTVRPGVTTGAATPPAATGQASGGGTPATQPPASASAQPGFNL